MYSVRAPMNRATKALKFDYLLEIGTKHILFIGVRKVILMKEDYP